MSFILDALKKIERERELGGMPTLETVHARPPRARPWFWPAVATIVSVFGTGVVAWLLLPAPPSTTVVRTGDQPPIEAANTANEPIESPPLHEPRTSETLQAAPPRDRAGGDLATPRGTTAAQPRVSLDPTPAARPSKGREPKPRPRVDLADGSHEARLPDEPGSGLAPGSAVRRAVDARPSDLANAPDKQNPGEQGAGSHMPTLQEMSAEIQEAVPKIKVNVLAYTEQAAERMVYINGHRYMVGQMVEGKLKLEDIVREGAVLSYQGQRFLLRP